jgi:hypothetical protein
MALGREGVKAKLEEFTKDFGDLVVDSLQSQDVEELEAFFSVPCQSGSDGQQCRRNGGGQAAEAEDHQEVGNPELEKRLEIDRRGIQMVGFLSCSIFKRMIINRPDVMILKSYRKGAGNSPKKGSGRADQKVAEQLLAG